MDRRLPIKILLIFLSGLLSGCSALPSQKFTFSLSSSDVQQKSWYRRGFADSGSLEANFKLIESMPDAAGLDFRFVGIDRSIPVVAIKVRDERCTGAYSVRIEYKSGSREFRTLYFQTKLEWGKDAKLIIHWNDSEQMSLALNDGESHTISLAERFFAMGIEANKGRVEIKEIAYKSD